MKPGSLARHSPFLPLEPSRQQAYLALIQRLLQCSSGEEPAVLESYQDLLDAEFLATCEQVAQMLEEQEDQNSALLLRNLATQLGEVIAAGGSGGGAEQQGSFLMQLLLTIAESQADPQVVYPFLRVNLPLLNSGVVAVLNQWWEGVLTGADREEQLGLAGLVFAIGDLLAQFPLGNPGLNKQIAITAYANALRVMDPVQRSTDCLRTARNLGNLGFTNNLPDVAIKGYLLAITAVENLRSVAIDPARKAEIVSQAIEVYANLVQVYVDQQQFDQALEVADRSKARNLVDLLSTKDLYPKGEIPEDVILRLDELRGSIARAERELNRGEKLSGSEFRPEAGLGGGQKSDDNLRQLKQDLDRLIQAEIIEIDPAFSLSQKVQPLSIEQLRATLPDERSVLVSWYVAGPKLIAFILAKTSSELICHRYSEPILELLIEELNSYFSAYASNRSAWFSALPETLNRLSVLLEMEALVGHIAKIAPQADQLILVPHRFLHLLPLHSLPFGNPTTTLVDQFSRGVRFAPSLQVLDVVQKRPQTPLQSLFALQNPTQDLLYTELEVAEIQALFAPRATVLQRQGATKAALEQQSALLASSNCLHYACHGYFNFAKPELSALILAGSTIEPALPDADANRYLRQRDGSSLDLNKCLTLLDLFALDLRQARLVALSACETGLSELNSLSDEFVGLSSGFLYAGCNSVIGTLWTVDDLSTGLLMGEFYRLLKQQEQTQPSTDVALALKQAQQWLRQLTCAEAVATLQRLVPSLDADGQESAKRSIRRSLSERYATDDRPYHHPFYWAAFCAVGQ